MGDGEFPWLRLRGLGAAVVEGTGIGSGSVAVGELRGLGGRGEDDEREVYKRRRSMWTALTVATDVRFISKITEQASSAILRDVLKEQSRVQTAVVDVNVVLRNSSHTSLGSDSLPGLAGARTGGLDSHGEDLSTTSTLSPPNPQAIAAVIVAIIVAIILLDLCIFRFPVGRNIRDFLVRKIPFCIAFYS
ncbi:hypothetical protein BBBOND_0110170 [Babesia bigemina]|uniref:Uncharacterized protein n=1 Tax=Babesia bigemina TaxID=5866 RepID=A0A061D717_BABBI|nr:hypothetical protein BBBOND_0110170 [Babesia bigemina]CDR94719.1 hypothetical protein BBBOND_0110170 [Babesia bigemina]|eukprot:XP_012766905.1 hypothetical protein BBBOND_0110170 [Babesia bigemina]